jgi:hypothetical protein
MPRPVPVPVRQKLWERAQQGESAADLATTFELSSRTVRHLLSRFCKRGREGLLPDYRPPAAAAHAKPETVRRAVLAERVGHPTWGSGLIRVALAEALPAVEWPDPRTMRRWFQQAGLGRAPAGRRPGRSATRATRPHHRWQIDAAEHIRLKDGVEVCWLRAVDEATGAVLGTAVFPPGVLDAGRPSRDPGVVASLVPALGATRDAESRQRRTMGFAGRLAHRLGLLAGRS